MCVMQRFLSKKSFSTIFTKSDSRHECSMFISQTLMYRMQVVLELAANKFGDDLFSVMSIIRTSTKDIDYSSSKAEAFHSRFSIMSVKVASIRTFAVDILAILLSLITLAGKMTCRQSEMRSAITVFPQLILRNLRHSMLSQSGIVVFIRPELTIAFFSNFMPSRACTAVLYMAFYEFILVGHYIVKKARVQSQLQLFNVSANLERFAAQMRCRRLLRSTIRSTIEQTQNCKQRSSVNRQT